MAGEAEKVFFKTFGCKANQYDTERMRQELEALGVPASLHAQDAQLCVVNTCTVTNQADADARRYIRRVQRENPGIRVVAVGCSSALKPPTLNVGLILFITFAQTMSFCEAHCCQS